MHHIVCVHKTISLCSVIHVMIYNITHSKGALHNITVRRSSVIVLPYYVLPVSRWLGGAMVLGKLPVPGRPTFWIIVGQGPIALAIGAGGGCLDIFTLLYPFSPLFPSLCETARYRLKYCLKGPLNPKQYKKKISLRFIATVVLVIIL